MIKYNNSNINDWYFYTSDIIKVYRNNAVCYYKISGGGDVPTAQTPCYAVVDNISQYSDTEFDDVFNKADNSWYKLNNLSQYEKYGEYGSGRTITYYEGKLTIDDNYEYIYSGSSWVNVGAVSGSSRVPQGYTEVDYIENTNNAGLNLYFKANQDTRIVTTMQTVTSTNYGRFLGAGGYDKVNAIQFDYENGSEGTLHVSWGTVAGWTIYSNCVGDYNKHTYDWNKNEFYRDETLIGSVTYGNYQCTDNLGIFCNINQGNLENFFKGKMFDCKVYDDGTLVRDLIPCKRDSDSVAGAYDIVNDVFYIDPNNHSFLAGSATPTPLVYPLYYDVIQDPPSAVTFSSMTEAESMECPYVGLQATINGDKYIFSGDSISGYEWVENTSRLPSGYTEVEYIQNTGTSYLNIAFTPNQDTRVVCDMQNDNLEYYPRLWGAGAWDSDSGLNLGYQDEDDEFCLHISWLDSYEWTYFTDFTDDGQRHIYDLNKNYLYMDNTLVGTSTYASVTASDPIGIFTYINDGRPSDDSFWGDEHFQGKMYSFKVYNNGTLVRDLIPCKRDSDNEVGAYDIVNDVFYTVPTGYTTDKLVAGNPI